MFPTEHDDPIRSTDGVQPTTILSRELVAAYEATDFQVLSLQPFTLRIGKKSRDLWSAYSKFGVATAGFITAWNPLSQETNEVLNAANQAELVRRVAALGFSSWDGLGIDPSGDWPGEPSIFVLGIERDDTVSLGIEFRQNAVVWAGADAIPRLVLLR